MADEPVKITNGNGKAVNIINIIAASLIVIILALLMYSIGRSNTALDMSNKVAMDLVAYRASTDVKLDNIYKTTDDTNKKLDRLIEKPSK